METAAGVQFVFRLSESKNRLPLHSRLKLGTSSRSLYFSLEEYSGGALGLLTRRLRTCVKLAGRKRSSLLERSTCVGRAHQKNARGREKYVVPLTREDLGASANWHFDQDF